MIPLYIINLKENEDRLSFISKRLGELNLKYLVVEAVDGRTLPKSEIDALTKATNFYEYFVWKSKFTRALLPGELGCFLSHKKCWEIIAQGNNQYGIVLEDDVVISRDFIPFVTSAKWVPNSVDIIQLSSSQKKYKVRASNDVIKLSPKFELINPVSNSIGTLGYLISKDLARKLLYLSQKIVAPIDNYLFSPWFLANSLYKMWKLNPSVICTEEDFETTVKIKTIKTKKANFIIRHGLLNLYLNIKYRMLAARGKEIEVLFDENR